MRPLLIALTLLMLPASGLPAAPRSTAELLVSDPCVLHGFVSLLRRTLGRDDMEFAAFIAEEDSSLVFLMWPLATTSRRQSYHGRVPPRTLALVHTHPSGCERPSEQDVREAERLRLPLFVLTHATIWVVDPEVEPRVRRVAFLWTYPRREEPVGCVKARAVR